MTICRFRVSIRLIKLAATKTGCRVLFENIPWKRQLSYAETGLVDVVMGAGKRKDRAVYLYYFEPYLYEPSVFVQLEKTAARHPIDSLRDTVAESSHFAIAALNGASYSQSYDELLKNPSFASHLRYTPSNEISIRLLLAQRVDLALFADPHEPVAILKTLGLRERIKLTPVDISSDEDDYAYFAYSKKAMSEAKAKEINDAILSITHSSGFEHLLRSYFTENEIRVLVPQRVERH